MLCAIASCFARKRNPDGIVAFQLSRFQCSFRILELTQRQVFIVSGLPVIMALKLMITLTVIHQLSTHKNYQIVFRSYLSAIGGEASAICLIIRLANTDAEEASCQTGW
jgi:hypothetical protein